MYHAPMLADFAVRLSFGLTVMLLLLSWHLVPLSFFRTQCQIILGLLVLATLDGSRLPGQLACVSLAVAAAALAYMAAVSWGLGLPRVAVVIVRLMTLATAGWLTLASTSVSPLVCVFNSTSRAASGFLLGATIGSMLLGHHHLTAPTMSIEPLQRLVRCMGWAVVARVVLAALGICLARSDVTSVHSRVIGDSSALFLVMRWCVGFAVPAVATCLTWKTVQLRSTQSATGILYAAMAFVLIGELSSLVEARAGGLIE
jgi:hypothetical protein